MSNASSDASSDIKLPQFSKAMKDFAVQGLRAGKEPMELTQVFPLVFPNFGKNVAEAYQDVVKDRIFSRICDIKRHNKDEIDKPETPADAKQTLETNRRKICASARHRLSFLLDLLDKTPNILSGEKQDKDNSANIMKIVDQIRLEMDRIDGFDGESAVDLNVNTPTSKMGAVVPSPQFTGGRDADPREETPEESG